MADKIVTLPTDVWSYVEKAIAETHATSDDIRELSALNKAYKAITGESLEGDDEDEDGE